MGTRIDSNAKTGKYTNSFVVKLVANAIPYTIIYDDNVVSNMPTDISSTTPDSTVNIASNTPTRAGYTFLGWCTVVPTNNNGTDTCTGGTTYQPSATLTIDQTGTGNNFHFYAMWKEDNSMQSFTTAKCNAMSNGSTITLTDSRDDQAYTIGKLADGNCWMVENLNLAGGTALDADKTDVTSAYISSFSTSNNLTKSGDTIVLPASNTSGFDTVNYSYVYNSGNKTNCGASGQNTPCYSYYSWDAATLGSGRTIATENTDAPYSVCPKGWKLPTSGNSSNNEWKRGDFYKLATAYGANLESNYYESSSTFYNNAGPNTTVPKFLLAGFYSNGSFNNGGSYGGYWSSTSFSNTSYARDLIFLSSVVNSASIEGRSNGISVRCLFSGQ